MRILIRMEFEWDEAKNRRNTAKHHCSFEEAKGVFLDKHRIIKFDAVHSASEPRYFCYGKTAGGRILTVRFTPRGSAVRIIGAGEWTKGKEVYAQENQKNQ